MQVQGGKIFHPRYTSNAEMHAQSQHGVRFIHNPVISHHEEGFFDGRRRIGFMSKVTDLVGIRNNNNTADYAEALF